jgi:hypothetical protein
MKWDLNFVLGLEADDEAEEDVVNEQWAVRDGYWYQIRSPERKARRQGHCWAEWEEALPPAAGRVIADAGVRVRVLSCPRTFLPLR